jgi:hypothetical protein
MQKQFKEVKSDKNGKHLKTSVISQRKDETLEEKVIYG